LNDNKKIDIHKLMKFLPYLILPLSGLLTQESAAINVTIEEIGTDVVASWSGTIDVSSLSGVAYPFNDGSFVIASASAVGSGNAGMFYYTGVFDSVINDFGSGGFKTADSATGTSFSAQFDDQQNRIVLPSGFTSGSISGSVTFNNETLSSLGITENYTFSTGLTLGAGKTDTFNFQTIAVPEPSAYAAISGLVALFFLVSRRRR
jgi:hypothetical protein